MDAPGKAPNVMGVPMKHISLITVRADLRIVGLKKKDANVLQLTFQNSALILVSTIVDIICLTQLRRTEDWQTGLLC